MVKIVAAALFIFYGLLNYILDHFFQHIENRLPSVWRWFKNKQRNRFYNTLRSDKFKIFQLDYLKRYYSEEFFTNVNGRNFHVYAFPYFDEDLDAESKGIRCYDTLAKNIDTIDYKFDVKKHRDYKKAKYYYAYHRIVSSNIKGPDRPGFMLKELCINDEGKMSGFTAEIGTYAENVYTNHVLEYEMYKLYKEFEHVDDSYWQDIYNKSVIRNAMHFDGKTMKESLAAGDGRQSLLSVQMLVLMKNKDGRYLMKIIQRSQNVAIAPGIYQLVPAGGFEIMNDRIPGYQEAEIKDNLSPGCAIFREYLEEIFGEPEYEGKGDGSVNEVLQKDSRIIEIEEMIERGDAKFEFLGSVIDLSGLRHELSFVLVINDPSYEKANQFRGNEEATNKYFISNVYLDNFEDNQEIWNSIHGPSAVMWELFKNTDLYRECNNGIR